MTRNHCISMSPRDIREIKASLRKSGNLERKFKCKTTQSNRFFRDSVVGAELGVDQMNTDIHGWDGFFDDGTPFENKNVTAFAKSQVSYSLKFQDTSDEKLQELQEGVICTTSFWANGELAWLFIGNTSSVGERLVKSFNPDTRRSSQVSFPTCIKNDFAIVAMGYDKEETIAAIANVFPNLARNITVDDIYGQKDLKTLVSEMK